MSSSFLLFSFVVVVEYEQADFFSSFSHLYPVKNRSQILPKLHLESRGIFLRTSTLNKIWNTVTTFNFSSNGCVFAKLHGERGLVNQFIISNGFLFWWPDRIQIDSADPRALLGWWVLRWRVLNVSVCGLDWGLRGDGGRAQSVQLLAQTWAHTPVLRSALYMWSWTSLLNLSGFDYFDFLGREKEKRKQSLLHRKRLLFANLTSAPHVLGSLGTFHVNYTLVCCHDFSFGIRSFGKQINCDCRVACAWRSESERGKLQPCEDWRPWGGLETNSLKAERPREGSCEQVGGSTGKSEAFGPSDSTVRHKGSTSQIPKGRSRLSSVARWYRGSTETAGVWTQCLLLLLRFFLIVKYM